MTRVTVSPIQIAAFARSWPCSGLPKDLTLTAEWDSHGNLVDYEWGDGADHADAENSGAMSALLDDARDGMLPPPAAQLYKVLCAECGKSHLTRCHHRCPTCRSSDLLATY